MKYILIFTTFLISVKSDEFERIKEIQSNLEDIYSKFVSKRGFTLEPSISNTNPMMTPGEDTNPILCKLFNTK